MEFKPMCKPNTITAVWTPERGRIDFNSELSLYLLSLSQGTKMELPLWLSKGLYERKRRVVSIELPKVYKEGWRTVFNADPNVVDLHKMGPYYYGLGSQMLHFDSPENPEIGRTLLQVNNMLKHRGVHLT